MAWIGEKNGRGFAAGSAPRGAVFGRAEGSVDRVTQAFLSRVYAFMAAGLVISGVVALFMASSPAAMSVVFGSRFALMVLLLAQVGLVMAFGPVATRVSAGAAAGMLVVYSALSGVTLASIFLIYTRSSIASTFLVSATMFGGLSAYGALTKRDLSGLGSFAMMGLVGLVIASVVNIFLGSSMLYWLTTFVGVIVFTGLAAYDTQKLKAMAGQAEGSDQETKLALAGALTLYLDFVNLFLYLLRIFGGRRRS